MADVEISYEGNVIASLSASGTKTLLTAGKYCDDDITVDYTSPGGGGTLPMTAAVIVGLNAGASWSVLGSSSSAWANTSVSTDLASISNGTITLLQAGTYNVYISIRGGNTTGGNVRYGYYRVYHNTTIISQIISNTVANGGANYSATITASANDTLYMEVQANTGASTSVSGSLVIEKTV